MIQEFYSIKEVAIILGVHESTVRRAVKRKILPFMRIGIGHKSPYRISKKIFEQMHIDFMKEMEK